MSQVIEAQREHQDDTGLDSDSVEPPRAVPVLALVVGAFVLVIAVLIGLRLMNSGSSTPSGALKSGSSVEVVLRCAGGSCIAGTTSADGTQWSWITNSGTPIPAAWLTTDATGVVTIDQEWGNATFTSGGQSLVVVGGKATPDHTFFG